MVRAHGRDDRVLHRGGFGIFRGQLSLLPTAVRWLWPSAIGVPGIFIWVGYYRRRFDRKGKPAEAAQGDEFRSGGEVRVALEQAYGLADASDADVLGKSR